MDRQQPHRKHDDASGRRDHKGAPHPVQPAHQQHDGREHGIELHLQPQAPVRQRRAIGEVRHQPKQEREMSDDVFQAAVEVAFRRLVRSGEEIVDDDPAIVEIRAKRQRQEKHDIEQRRDPEIAARPEFQPGFRSLPRLLFLAQLIVEQHQEAGQHDEQVDAEIRLADDRNLPAGQKHAVPDQHPDRRKRAKPVQAFDARRLDDGWFRS